MSIKSKISLAIGALVLGITTASATTITSPGGATFTVGSSCTVAGNVANLGIFSIGQTVAAYGARHGKQDGNNGYALSLGTASPVLLATVTCPSGTGWNLWIDGSGAGGNVDFMNPSNAFAFSTIPYATDVSGTAVNDWVAAFSAGVYQVGTGVAQEVNGKYILNVPSGSTIETTPLVAGTYTATTTARLDF